MCGVDCINICGYLTCEVFAYIVSIMMLMSCDMCSVAHIHGTLCSVRNVMCEVFDGILVTHMLMSCNYINFSAHIM